MIFTWHEIIVRDITEHLKAIISTLRSVDHLQAACPLYLSQDEFLFFEYFVHTHDFTVRCFQFCTNAVS